LYQIAAAKVFARTDDAVMAAGYAPLYFGARSPDHEQHQQRSRTHAAPARASNDTGRCSAQNPSSARPTQENAKRPQAAAATEASVAIVFVTGMTEPCVTDGRHFLRRCQRKNGEKMLAGNNERLWPCCNMNLILPAKIRIRAA
jgi:hypothetical protein